MRLTLTANDRARFWAKVKRGADNECWEWTAARFKSGYGAIQFGGRGGRKFRAHRVSFALANNGELPDGLNICHACDNPPCVNPAHLYAGTQADNMSDMKTKGRLVNPTGERHGESKLTAADVIAIRAASANGEIQRTIATRFGVTRSQVSNIVNRKSWTHIA